MTELDQLLSAFSDESATSNSPDVLASVLDEFQIHDPAVRRRIGALAQLESSGNPAARGPKISGGMHDGDQARGLLQIMPKTARDYPEYNIDDDRDAARAGVRYFMDNLDRFGDLDLATVAHHGGPGAAQRRAQTGSAGSVDRATGLATDDYLARIRAAEGGDPSSAAGATSGVTYTGDRGQFLTDTASQMQADRRQAAADASPISTSLERGIEGIKHNAGLFVDNLAGDAEGVAKRMQDKRAWDLLNPAPSSSQEFLRDWADIPEGEYGQMLGAFLSNPGGAFNQVVEQTPNSAPGMAFQIAALALASTGLGAPAALALQGIAAFAGNVLPEGGAIVEEMLAKDGVDIDNAEAVAAWAQANRGRLLHAGVTKAGVISVNDALAAVVGTRIIAGPTKRFLNAERTFAQKSGVDLADAQAMARLRGSAGYQQAMAPEAQRLLAATTGAQKVMRGIGGVAVETVGEGTGEYTGSLAATGEASGKDAILEGVMGGATSVGMTTAQAGINALNGPDATRAQLKKLANSPLTNAANAAAAATPANPSAPQAGGALVPAGEPELSPEDARLERVRSFVEDKDFIRGVRATEGMGKESVNEVLSAYAKARNPNVDPMIRERALSELEAFIEAFNNRPNFQYRGQAGQPTPNVPATTQPQGGEIAPAAAPADDGMTLDGEVIERPGKLAGANPNQLAAPPVHGLASPEAMEARRNADADYEQAFQDLVKADALGQSGAELEAVQRRMIEAEARLNEIAQTLAGSEAAQAEARRRRVLAGVLANPEVQNHEAAFAAELGRQGFRDAAVTEAERARIARFMEVRDAFTAPPEVEPSAPNELDPYVSQRETGKPAGKPAGISAPNPTAIRDSQTENAPASAAQTPAPVGNTKPAAPKAPAVTVDQIREAVASGARLDGNKLTIGEAAHTLKGPLLAAAKNATRQQEATNDAAALDAPSDQPGRGEPAGRGGAAPDQSGSAAGGEDGDARTGTADSGRDEAGSVSAPVLGEKPVEAPTLKDGNEKIRSAGSRAEDDGAGDSAALRGAEGAIAGRSVAGPWFLEDLFDEETGAVSERVVDAGDYLDQRSAGNQILTAAVSNSLLDRDRALGLTFEGMERPALAAGITIRFTDDKSVDGDLKPSEFESIYDVTFGDRTVRIDTVELGIEDSMVGVTPLVLLRNSGAQGQGGSLSGFRVEGVDGIFDFLDAVDQAAALLYAHAQRSPKGQQIDAQVAERLDDAAEPTAAQKEAENYKKAHVSASGQTITIETPKGAQRTGTSVDGEAWSITMPAHYGYLKGTVGADKDHVDIFLGPEPDNGVFYIVNQNQPGSDTFDEHKVMLGYASDAQATADYLLSFSDDFGGEVFGSIAGPFTKDEFVALVPSLAKSKAVTKAPKGGKVATADEHLGQPADKTPIKKTLTEENAEERHADAKSLGAQAARDGAERTPPTAFTAVEKSKWLEGFDQNPVKKTSDAESAPSEESGAAGGLPIKQFEHTKTGKTQYVVQLPAKVEKEVYQAVSRRALANKGRWSNYAKDGAIAGFLFQTEANAQAFAADPVVLQAAGATGKESLTVGQEAASLTGQIKTKAAEIRKLRDDLIYEPAFDREEGRRRLAKLEGEIAALRSQAAEDMPFAGQEAAPGDSVAVVGGKYDGTIRTLIGPAPYGRFYVSDTISGRIDVPGVELHRKAQSAAPLTYDEFKAEMQRLLSESMKYKPSEVGAGTFAEKMADLSEQHPEFQQRLDAESDASETASSAYEREAARMEILPVGDGAAGEYVVGYAREDGSRQNFARFKLSEKTGKPVRVEYFYEHDSGREPARMAIERWEGPAKADEDLGAIFDEALDAVFAEDEAKPKKASAPRRPADTAQSMRDEFEKRKVDFIDDAKGRAGFIRRLKALAARTDGESVDAMILDGLATKLNLDDKRTGVPETLEFRAPQAAQQPAPRSSGAAAKSAAKNAGAGLADIAKGLNALFKPKPGTLGSGPVFTEETYAAAKPLFIEGIKRLGLAGADALEMMKALIRELRENFGMDRETIANMKPYAMRFVEDSRAGKIVYDESDSAQGADDEQVGNDRGNESALAPVSPGTVQGTEGEGDAGEGSTGVRGPDAEGDGGSAEDARDEPAGGVAGEPEHVLPEGPDVVDVAGQERPLDEVAESVKNDPPASEPKPKFPARFGDNPGNYRITDADAIGTGTTGERIRANMAAVRLVLALESENRYPTREEQAVLVKYVGWGGLKNVFKGDNSSSKQERDAHAELKKILTPEQLFWMGQSVLDAHYTSPTVIRSIYSVLSHFGVEGGRFLEPTVGVGNFIGLMPEPMASSAKWFGSEIDPVTSLIAKHLYPDAQILPATGFQDAEFAYGRMDVAIGNPPFGDQRITDTNKKRADINGFKIHNYIISKAAMHLRPGGVMSFVVTSRFLDTANPEAREFLAKNFRLLAAIRLPNTAFAENAGTEVTTDLIFLQRRREVMREVEAEDLPWLDTKGRMLNEDGDTVELNRYFAERPEMMLGKPSMAGTMYGSRSEKGEFTLMPREGETIDEGIAALIDGPLADLQGVAKARASDVDAAAAAVEFNREDVPIGGFFDEGGNVIQRIDDDEDGNTQFRQLTADTPWTAKQTLGATRLDRLKGMLELRALAYDLMADERADVAEDRIETRRAALNKAYDAFVDKFGFLNDNANRTLMDADPRIEFGLEADYRKEITKAKAKTLGQEAAPAQARKASLLKERVFFPKEEIDHADSPADGYAVSLSEKGRLDLDYIAGITDSSVEDVIKALSTGEKPLIFKDPGLNKWVQEDEYLSGNVKEKLKVARGAGLEANIRALEAVQPADIEPENIHAEFGATWIRAEVYEDFLKLFGYGNVKVAVMPKSGAVEAVSVSGAGPSPFRADIENPDYTIDSVFNAVANRRQMVAHDGSGDSRTVNRERTENLGRIREKLIAIWKDWIKSDPVRLDLLAKDYNDIMNTTVERKFDGVTHLRTVGAAPDISLRNSQKIAAWRMVQSSTVLMDQVVGAGKTMALVTGLMERKRLGLSKKPMVVVPNHLVGQWARDWIALYPGANVLAATEKDFQKQNRRRLFARIATGKFDAIIVGHSSFGFIPVSREAETEFVMKEVEHLEAALTEAEQSEGGKKGKGDSRRVRGIKNRIAKRMEKIRELQDKPRDNVATFEDMGIDYLAVDELHEFKNLEYATTLSNVAGMGSPEGAKKAFDLYMKMRLLQEWGGGIAGATGTPISNSMVEMYSLLRYLNPGALAARNLEQFDAWVKAFASIELRDEYTASGKIKQRTVMAAFNNLPELLQMYKQVADTVTMSDLKRIYAEQMKAENAEKGTKKREEFPVPKVKGGERRLDIGAPTPEQVEFMDYLIARADILDKLKGKAKQEYASIDNALWLMNDARKMSLDVRIIDPSVPDSENSKASRAARNIKRIYDASDADLGAQLVFCDLSTPSKNAGKDAGKFIKDTLKTLGMDSDKAVTAALDGKSYEDQWAFLRMRAELQLDGGRLGDAQREKVETFLESVGDDEISALRVADSGFSVYDDLKKKLIASGIAEREIAFIHDATTSDKKRELFDLVNAGKVRVLIGSSAKMGAGTNVQRRLVALHHMDAPWRPSDIEQREGRIIRQGNMFYERNPDKFEVEIVAYSTERTFDAQMWGVLARKAGFLEQFRQGLRTITEEGGDAASYAEFMAEATGDQIFRDKLRLERELSNLEADDRSSRMKRLAAQQLIDTAQARLEKLGALLEEARRLEVASLESVTFEGNAYRDDLNEVIEAEMETFREERTQFEADDEAYRIARKAWEDAAGTERGRAPAKPKPPEIPEFDSPRVREKSEWAQLIDLLTKRMELIGDGDSRTYTLIDASGAAVPISAKKYNETEVVISVGGDRVTNGLPRGAYVGAALTPHRLRGQIRSRAPSVEREIRMLQNNVEQANVTLEHVKPVDEAQIAELRKQYEDVKLAVDEVSARMAAERAQRPNRFVDKDKRRFGDADASANVQREAMAQAVHAYKFRTVGTGSTREVSVVGSAKPVVLEGLDGLEFFVFNDKVRKNWFVIEASSGLSIGNGDTRAAAIARAEQQVAAVGADKVKSVVGNAEKITDEEKADAVVRFSPPAVARASSPAIDGMPATEVRDFARAFAEAYPAAPEIFVAHRYDNLPAEVRADLESQGVPRSVRGVLFRGTVYVVAGNHDTMSDVEETIFHEVVGHAGVRKLFGPQFVQKLNQVFMGLGGVTGLQKIMDRRGQGGVFAGYVQRILAAKAKNPETWTDDMARAVLTEEVYAHIAERGSKGLMDKFLELVGMVRAFLRKAGMSLAELGESDLLYTLSQARAVLQESGSTAVMDGVAVVSDRTKEKDNGQSGTAAGELPGQENADRAVGGAPRLGWAGATRIRGKSGRPATVYRGAGRRLSAEDFAQGALGVASNNPTGGLGVWLSLDQDDAAQYGEVESFHLDMRNPKVYRTDSFPAFDSVEEAARFAKNLQRQGYDGIVVDYRDIEGPIHFVAFSAKQVVYPKTDGGPGVARDSAPAVARVATTETPTLRTTLRERIADLFDTSTTFNWWQKTVGSQYGKAKSSPEFGRVYAKAHAFVDDVSLFANRAADMARGILPHMDTFADIGRGANLKYQWSNAKDYQEIAKALFEGTLADKAFTERELRDDYGLSETQIGLYNEFRAAVDFSLDTLGASELARSARVAKMELADQAMTLEESVSFYESQLDPGIEALREAVEDLRIRHRMESEALDTIELDETFDLEAMKAAKRIRDKRQAAEIAQAQAELAEAEAFRASFGDKLARIRDLQNKGYAPLMRFGQFTVDVVRLDEDGKVMMNDEGEPDRPFFAMFESEAEAKESAKILAEEYPGYTVNRGVMSVESSKLYAGLTPETAEMFGRMLGTDAGGAFQAYLKQAVANRSAMKRLIQRKGMDGFSQDVPRVLAAFITSNARLASGNWHFGEMAKAVEDIPQHMGDVKDQAIRLMQYIQNPQEEAAALRGFLFFSFLGGSVASAAVNMTQTFSTTIPYLHQFGGAKTAKVVAKAMADAVRLMRKGFDGVGDAELREALHRASEEGIIDPQEIHLLMAESGNGGGNVVGRLAGAVKKDWQIPAERLGRSFAHLWGSMFGAAEKYNRHVAFLAAWELAPAGRDRYQFAKDAVTETQFDYTKANRPNWARGVVGATLFCVDEGTEALTRRGWLGPDELKPGDMLASFDMESERLKWAPMKSVHVFDHDGEMVHAKSKTLDMLLTPDHRVVHYRRARKPGGPRGEMIWRLEVDEAQNIPTTARVQIPTAAEFDHEPVGEPIADAIAPLLGWIATEGYFRKTGDIRIYQNEGPDAVQIRKDLEAAGYVWREFEHTYERGSAPHKCFFIKKSLSGELRALMPGKQITPALLMRMTKSQIAQMVDRMIRGDGSVQPNGTRCFLQNEGQTLEAFQMALTILGKSYSVRAHNGGNTKAVLIREPSRNMVGRYSISSSERVHYKGRVWCPIVPGTSTWVARRNGMPFITHNTFKTFLVNYMEFLARLPRKEQALALAVLVLLSGISGLPGMDDLDDVIDGIGQKLGYNWNNKAGRHTWLVKTLGADGADFVQHGVSSFMPLDVSARLGMGNIVPGTGLLKKSSANKSRDVEEFFGPAASVAGGAVEVFDNLGTGKGIFDLLGPVSPKSFNDIRQAVDMVQTGAYRDRRGREVVDVSLGDAFWKGIGFHPNKVAEPKRVERMLAQTNAMQRAVRSDIHELRAQGIYEGDPEKSRLALEMVRDWNRKNPESPIHLNPASIAARVSAMRKTSADRLVKATPRDMRGMVRAGLQVTD